MDTLKIAVLGSPGVGKTAIIRQFTTGTLLSGDYIPTKDEIRIVRREINGKLLELEINDTAGSDEQARVREIAIVNAEAFVVVYSVTSRDSFLDSKKFIENIQEIKQGKQIPIVLVGSKRDLEVEKGREVTQLEGETMAKEFQVIFLEVSAKEEKLVESVFTQLVQHVELKRQEKVKSDLSVHKKEPCCIVL